ncbi:MAG TPA: zinc-binding dehydrogenase, partial [Telluria sp.]|nr:zinc-binding dehydrogenase [Telluria sp.]
RYYPLAARLVAPQGAIGLAVEATLPVDLGLLWDKSVTLAWEMVYTRVDYGTPDLAAQQAILNEVGALADRGVLRPIDSEHLGRITAANLRAAHRRMAGGRMTGKLVLEGFNDV